MVRIKLVIFFISIITVVSCKQNRNELEQVKKINNICYTLRYISKEENKNGVIEPADLFYYKLTISEEEKTTHKISELYLQTNYNRLLYYINSNIKNDFKIIKNEKENYPVQVYFESNNRISNKLIFMIAFEKPIEHEGDFIVEFNDNIFNNGKIKFKYNIEELI